MNKQAFSKFSFYHKDSFFADGLIFRYIFTGKYKYKMPLLTKYTELETKEMAISLPDEITKEDLSSGKIVVKQLFNEFTRRVDRKIDMAECEKMVG